jgi:hypothetical protein
LRGADARRGWRRRRSQIAAELVIIALGGAIYLAGILAAELLHHARVVWWSR